ncbi:Collagen alpha-1(VII) chain Long-chain collagen [Fibrella aestuarina BUZ 2]|uniref:Collagen alpha-1(VII) chain Long-chain collagen n=1 Tax=Fibrella aestuarina BUZ 2 TaxID=1166018 RepID=I0KEJ3_9BACT|nr:T9SS type A sorting domain-containing protein [Fibrella aestuarina]CCH02546.1 Collagen alpha-1(VII) chain Long-chain collagen [Fibrella aestuarina BUZ 2]
MNQFYSLSITKLVFFWWVSLLSLTSQAQRIGPVAFQQLPQPYQLYPRNAQSTALIPVAGRVEEAGWEALSVRLFRNKQPIASRRVPLTYAGNSAAFQIDPLPIRAEKAEYDVSVTLWKGTDSVNVVTRTNIVAGDVFVLAGQSNAGAFFRDTRTNEFCRTFGVISENYGKGVYNPADTAWALSNQTLYTQNVGNLGFGIQQYILEKYGIPTCLINGAMHWSSMNEQAIRTATNPTDLTTGYGRLLYRLQKAGVANAVTAWVYRQGETEGYGESTDWLGGFGRYYQQLKTDVPSVKQFYVYQIDIIDPAVGAAPFVRESQRTLPRTYPDIQVVASVGTEGFDGLHYSDAGYDQNAMEVARLIGRDFYNDPDQDNIDAPNLRQAYYSTAARDEITLQFNPGQRMNWTDGHGSLKLTQFLYLDGQAGSVQSGRAEDNRIILKLNGPSGASKLTYLPATYTNQQPDYPYRGPYLTNKRGLRALSFLDVPIAANGPSDVPTVATPSLSASVVSASSVRLTWSAVAGATGYVFEAKAPSASSFATLAQLPRDQQAFVVENLPPGAVYAFRVKAIRRDDESAYAQVDVQTPAVLTTPELQATATYATAVRLHWNAIADAQRYVLERRTTAETSFTAVATLPPATLLFQDSLLVAGQRYTYRLKATGRFTDSPYAEVTVQTPAYLPTPELTVAPQFNDALLVSWKPVANATHYALWRKTGTSALVALGTFEASVTAVSDAGLQPGTTYTYQLQAFGDRTESPIVRADAQTPGLLATPTMSSTVVYTNAIRLAWMAVPNATAYQLERMTDGQAYRVIGSYGPTVTTLVDTALAPGTAYAYRVKAKSPLSESVYGVTSATTTTLLSTPVLSVTVLYNNALRLGWASVPAATSYQLERMAAGQSFQTVGTYGAGVSAVRDTLLAPGTSYTYRLRALGDRTESPYGTQTAQTPALLSTPALSATAVAFDTLRLRWDPVPSAAYYWLERRKTGESAYSYTTRVDAGTTQYVDAGLSPSTTYQYRLTAFGDKTQSAAATASGTTLVLLATQFEPAAHFRLWPNPARGKVTLQFARPTTGTVQLIDLRGLVHKRQTVQQATESPLLLPDAPAGTYLIRVESGADVYVQKLLIE